MKDKILVFVTIPAIELEINVYIPTAKKIGSIKNLIIEIVEEVSNGIFKNDNCKKLYDKKTGEVLNDREFVRYSNIKNGSKLIL